jgi:hypothetical protein
LTLPGAVSLRLLANIQPINETPQYVPALGIVPGLFFIGAGPRQYDPIGRYFTLGFRAQL